MNYVTVQGRVHTNFLIGVSNFLVHLTFPYLHRLYYVECYDVYK